MQLITLLTKCMLRILVLRLLTVENTCVKENNVTQAIFDKVWKVCDLPSLLLIKVAVTRWFSKNKATLCDLDWWDLLLQNLIESINVKVNYLHQDNMMIIFSWLYYNEYKYISCIRLN